MAQTAFARPDSKVKTGSISQSTSLVAGYETIAQRISKFVEHELKDKGIPSVAISLVDGNQVVFAQGYGTASPDGTKPATGDSVYRIGSVSKLFTDICVMQLVAAGKLDLDADIRKYLPEFQPRNPFGVPITLRQLMSHKSGIVRESPVGSYFDDTSPTLAATIASVNDTDLVYKPGTHTKYSNVGVSVAGLVVERLVGRPFEEHIRQTLLDPLEMPVSSFRATEAVEQNRAIGWMRSYHAPPTVAPNFALGTLPAGNLYSSMNELSHFMIALLNGGRYHGKQVVEAQVLESMLHPTVATSDKVNEYGIGFRLGELEGHRTFGHGGAVYGYSTQFVGIPTAKIGVATSASFDGASGFVKRLSEYALRLMLAQKAGKPLPAIEVSEPIAPALQRKLVGTYVGGEKLIRILEQEGGLALFDGTYLTRLRAQGSNLVVDDLEVYGPSMGLAEEGRLLMNDRAFSKIEEPCPQPPPSRFARLIGEYGWDHNVLYILEDRGQLWALIEWFYFYPLTEVSPNVFAFPPEGLYHGEHLVFGEEGEKPAPYVTAASVRFNRRPVGLEGDKPFQIQPTKPVEELYRIARAASPPHETNRPRPFDLVELIALDPSIKFDIRYATKNNFLGTEFYKEARAFMQRPAAEALVRVHKNLMKKGYGLVVYDAYRPWYVTKMFWEGTAGDQHKFVADPSQGSKHNRGCAVDVTLVELKTGKAVEMVSGYDEMSFRSYPFYPGGASNSRWYRSLLRDAMLEEGFTGYETEWWHFDYKDWEQYPIGTVSFEEIQTE
ncbi:MAG: serine hydrolase [Pirellulales bacterium]|nr:serine hydrolase [Pirellulales bacterium]